MLDKFAANQPVAPPLLGSSAKPAPTGGEILTGSERPAMPNARASRPDGGDGGGESDQGANGVPPAARPVVMVVDDDDAIREALEDVLGDEGYDVIGASDGQQALDYLNGEKRPNAILVDLWMPVMDGWKFLDALLADARFSEIPLVVLTAARDQRVRELRVAEVLTKPVQLHQVLGALQRLTTVA